MSKRKTVADTILDTLREEYHKKHAAMLDLQREAATLGEAIDRIVQQQAQQPARKPRKSNADSVVGVRAVEDVARMARG